MAEVFPEETMAEIYAETPNARFAGTFGSAGAVCEAVDGGYRIRHRGRWPYNSNSVECGPLFIPEHRVSR